MSTGPWKPQVLSTAPLKAVWTTESLQLLNQAPKVSEPSLEVRQWWNLQSGLLHCLGCVPDHQRRLPLQLVLAGFRAGAVRVGEVEQQAITQWLSPRSENFLGPLWAHLAFTEGRKKRGWAGSVILKTEAKQVWDSPQLTSISSPITAPLEVIAEKAPKAF